MTDFTVELYIYDISKGLAKNLAHLFLGGKQIEGIWHTGVVVYGEEFFFGGEGISSCPPTGTILGSPDKILKMGTTQINAETFKEFLFQQSQKDFKSECYHLFNHNCNTFSDVVCQFLTGKEIPSYITGLPAEVMNTPLGSLLKPFYDQMSPKISAKSPLINSKHNSIENIDPVFKTHYDSSELASAISSCSFNDDELKLVNEIMEYLLVNHGEENFWNIAPPHINLLCILLLKDNYKKIASMLLQMICLRTDVSSLIFKYKKSNFLNFVEEYEKYSDDIFTEILFCICNILCCRINFEFFSDNEINLFTNICQHSLLSPNLQINLLSCKLLNNMLIIGKDKFDVFTLGVSFIELYNRNIDQFKDDIFMWRCFKMALELNVQLIDVCRAMQVSVSLHSSNQKIDDIIKQIDSLLT